MANAKKKLKKKTKIRESHRTFVRKTISEVKESLDGGESVDFKKLKSFKTTLQDKVLELKGMDQEVLEYLYESKIDEDVSCSCDFASAIQACIMDLETALISEREQGRSQGVAFVLQSAEAGLNRTQTPAQTATNSSVSSIHSQAKLPKLELKKFYGNHIDWYPFWESFESAVHLNSTLTGVDKFNYLKSLLGGSAAHVIAGLTMTNANYEKAIDLLKQRFGNCQLVISSHMEVTKIPRITAVHEVKRLRNLYDTVESHVRGLESLEISQEMYGCFPTPIIMQKLPEEFRIAITRNLTSEAWVLKDILTEFEKELHLRENCQHVHGDVASKESQFPNPSRRVPLQQPSTTSALFTEGGKSIQQGPWCTYCKGTHPSVNCNVMTHISARKQMLRQKGRCFRCLRTGHLANQCQNGKVCNICGLRHHASICENLGTESQSIPLGRSTVTKEGSALNPGVASLQAPTTTMVVNSKSSVLLQTARANVSKPGYGERFVNARMVFDSASQRSYISENLQKTLNLPIPGQETLLIKTFGESTVKLRRCDIVQMAVEADDGMQCLRLADNSHGDEELNIDILIGADFYWHFVSGSVVRGPGSGPIALLTRLGYVLSGPVGIPVPEQGDSTVNLTETRAQDLELCH